MSKHMIGSTWSVRPCRLPAKILTCAIATVVTLGVAPPSGATSDLGREAILAPTRDFSKPERFEDLPGGTATNRKRFDRDAFSQPSANLSFEQRASFFVGNGLFRRVWVSAPSSTVSSDGLGPLFNAKACQRCHLKDGRGHPPAGPHEDSSSLFLRLSIPPRTEAQRQDLASHRISVIPDPVYGGQLQDRAIQGHVAEGQMSIRYEEMPVTFADGETVTLHKPTYGVTDLKYGPLHKEAMLSPRIAPPVIGLGLLEAVPEADILSRADPGDRDGNGISGRPNRVWSNKHGKVMLGRFGWKAGQPTIADQNAGAMEGDIGIASRLGPSPWGDCTKAQEQCRSGPHGGTAMHGGFEADDKIMDLILFYTQNLAVPARRAAGGAQVLRGKEIFYASGCTGCHTPKLATSKHDVEALSGQLIWPYTDLLLHDMGEGLADNRPEGMADGREWRTPPLWGLGMTETVSGHSFFLHDGRARNLTEAILWHGGEATESRQQFTNLSKLDREALLVFLKSL